MCRFGRMYRLWDTHIVAPLDPETDDASFICLGDRGNTPVHLTRVCSCILALGIYFASFLHDSNRIDWSVPPGGLLCLAMLWESRTFSVD